jgi:hypothetical protein
LTTSWPTTVIWRFRARCGIVVAIYICLGYQSEKQHLFPSIDFYLNTTRSHTDS